MLRGIFLAVCLTVLMAADARPFAFRIFPYVQNPRPDGMTLCWFSNSREPGVLTVSKPDQEWRATSQPVLAESLRGNPFVPESGAVAPAPFKHLIRVNDLLPGTEYRYRVVQDGAEFSGIFKTTPDSNSPIRFAVYSDSETEPESTNTPVDWPPSVGSNRPRGMTKYVVDQTTGYRENLKSILASNPDFISVVGDLAEAGGEQRDWNEFWKHNSGSFGTPASRIPILPALGNHENYAGPGGGYTTAAANFATDKYLTYFDVPANGATNPKHRGRYYRIDYGPVTLITLDSSDGLPDQTASDTNFSLAGTNAPDFNPKSEQYRWLIEQLASAQKRSQFTFVQFHHTMYGSGPHSIPFGHPNFSGQSGIAMRVLKPILFQYGVDAVFSGHDEMLERSMVEGEEQLPDGTRRPHQIHFYDVGIGGDGLRGPSVDYDNPYRKFLAHNDAPEVWEGRRLISGGKHYGHLEVEVKQNADHQWQATLTPVYVFPMMDQTGAVVRWERRTYQDVVTLTSLRGKPVAAIELKSSESSPDACGVLITIALAVLGVASKGLLKTTSLV